MSKVVIEHMNGIHYPLPDDNFNPDKCYPEYPFGSKEISTKPNNAYELVRNCLADMGLMRNTVVRSIGIRWELILSLAILLLLNRILLCM